VPLDVARRGTLDVRDPPLKAIVAATDNYEAGYHEGNAGGLDAVDTDIAGGNIALGTTIFGKVGTVVAGGTETIDSDSGDLASGADYTPADSGIFVGGISQGSWLRYSGVQYYDDTNWYWAVNSADTSLTMAIGDGTNLKINNISGLTEPYRFLRNYISTGTYERESFGELVAGATYTPADSGFFSCAYEDPANVDMELNLPTDGWVEMKESTTTVVEPFAIALGDGTNLRVHNRHGATAFDYTLMRAKLIT